MPFGDLDDATVAHIYSFLDIDGKMDFPLIGTQTHRVYEALNLGADQRKKWQKIERQYWLHSKFALACRDGFYYAACKFLAQYIYRKCPFYVRWCKWAFGLHTNWEEYDEENEKIFENASYCFVSACRCGSEKLMEKFACTSQFVIEAGMGAACEAHNLNLLMRLEAKLLAPCNWSFIMDYACKGGDEDIINYIATKFEPDWNMYLSSCVHSLETCEFVRSKMKSFDWRIFANINLGADIRVAQLAANYGVLGVIDYPCLDGNFEYAKFLWSANPSAENRATLKHSFLPICYQRNAEKFITWLMFQMQFDQREIWSALKVALRGGRIENAKLLVRSINKIDWNKCLQNACHGDQHGGHVKAVQFCISEANRTQTPLDWQTAFRNICARGSAKIIVFACKRAECQPFLRIGRESAQLAGRRDVLQMSIMQINWWEKVKEIVLPLIVFIKP
jgi:hypothetical protein